MKLTERDVMESFVGKIINRDKFTALAKDHGDEYVIHNIKYEYDRELRKLFGVTDTLQDHWLCSGLDFEIHITLDGDTITNAFLDKYKERETGHCRCITRVLTPTQQELRVARRIMEYITV